MAYEKQVWQSNELITAEKLNHIEDGIALAVNPDVVNNLTETTTGKVLDATQGKILNDNKLGNNFSTLSVASTPYNGNEQIALYSGGENYSTTVNELLSAAGGSGSSQSALVNYVKNCGTISSLPQTFTDANITADMVVLESVLGTPSAQTGDWTVTTTNGSVTISGSISESTTLMLYFGVGMSAAPTLLTNLASTSAANILNTAPRPGVMGILSKSNGGTGVNATDNADLLDKIGVTAAVEQSAAINRVTLNASSMTFDSPLSLYKTNVVERTGHICVAHVSIKIDNAVTGKNYVINNYLPANMRPHVGLTANNICDTGLGDGKGQSVEIDANGVLRIWPVNLNKTTYCIGNVVFVCD